MGAPFFNNLLLGGGKRVYVQQFKCVRVQPIKQQPQWTRNSFVVCL